MSRSNYQSPQRKRGVLRAFAYASGSAILMMLAAPASARTITVTAEDCDQMAAIAAFAPRLSWVTTQPGNGGVFQTHSLLYWNSKIAVLMRFPFADIIPKGQRITKAELTLTPSYIAGGEPKITVRRILAEWGTGVCQQYRVAYPEKIEWNQPGARGAATDRAAKDSGVFHFAKIGPQTVDLTEDVELWYTAGAANRGWIFTMETDGQHVYLPSPYAPYVGGGKQWKLQITYEPQ
jgi:hypothetical protein